MNVQNKLKTEEKNVTIIKNIEMKGRIQMNQNEIIPVVLASDNNYAIPMYVTITSLVSTADRGTKYSFYLLVTDDFSPFVRESIMRTLEEYQMPEPSFITMHDAYENAKENDHITHAAYYRLKIPSLLPAVDKCIYLDVDIVVCTDLKELYNVDMEVYYIAGVKAARTIYNSKNMANRKMLDIESMDSYVNSGMLVMNLKKMRDDHMEMVFESLVEKKFDDLDQAVLNVACYNHIRILDLKYNLMTTYPVLSIQDYGKTEFIKYSFSKCEWKEAIEHPAIIHYANREKPWTNLSVPHSNKWWKIFEKIQSKTHDTRLFMEYQSRFYKRTLTVTSQQLQKKDKTIGKFKEYYGMLNQWLSLKQKGISLEKFFTIHKYKTIAIYGMGKLGNRLYDELKNSTDVEVKYGIDHNTSNTSSGLEIRLPEDSLIQVDVMVVTAVFAFDAIKAGLKDAIEGEIISLDSVVFGI